MRTTISFGALLAMTAGAAVSATAAPMHFVNVTSSRIVQTVGEVATNEKAIDLGDFDNDGDLDVVMGIALSDFGAKRNKLYRNDNGVFNEITSAAIPGFLTARVTRVTFLRDYDGDGWLDIYSVNDSNSHPDRLFINQHPGGVFTGFTEVFGLPSGGILGASCSGVSEDFDGDGDIDVYMGNYPNDSADRLISNNGNGTFTNISSSVIPISGSYVVDVSMSDMNGDGQEDLLITNDGAQGAYVMYNNNNNAGSGMGDFSYPNSTTNLGTSSIENALEPADFNNDGRMDIYWSGRSGTNDVILQNSGNDGAGKAIFSTLPNGVLPPSVTSVSSRKTTVVDFNNDGRIDAFVMKEGGSNLRPTILRNTSVNGDISFVDWTEASAFPSGTTYGGWHAVTFDSNNDGDIDILVGAFVNDHLFEQMPGPTFSAASLAGGVVPGVFNGSATVVTSSKGASNTFVIEGVASGSFVSAVVAGDGASDITLEVLSGGTVLGTSDRGGAGVEEALQVNNLPSGSVTIRVSAYNVADLNADTIVNGADLGVLLVNWGTDGQAAGADLTNDGIVNGADLGLLLVNWGSGSVGNFTLELLARTP